MEGLIISAVFLSIVWFLFGAFLFVDALSRHGLFSGHKKHERLALAAATWAFFPFAALGFACWGASIALDKVKQIRAEKKAERRRQIEAEFRKIESELEERE